MGLEDSVAEMIQDSNPVEEVSTIAILCEW
jgi:hypothetical protein